MSSTFELTHPRLSRLLSIHNPFYLISVLLVLIGLHRAFAGDRTLLAGWLLMCVLCGYTLLLFATGYVIIRYGQVWEDARMILLVIVLLFLALSISFDKILLDHPAHGAGFLLLGLAFSIAVSEAVFRSLRIHLAARYRRPFYLVLALLFIYPLGLAQLSVADYEPTMLWCVFLFPLVAGMALLTLWPATRTPGRSEPPNGTPWSWPWFPWSLFAFLLIAIALRSYSLSMTFEIGRGTDAAFQFYFLSPLLLAAALLLLEVGIVNDSPRARLIALLLPVIALSWSLPGTNVNPVASAFLATLSATISSPIQLALAGVGLYYLVAWWRGFLLGEIGLMACLLLASMVDRYTVDLASLTPWKAAPLALVAIIQLPQGLARDSSWRIALGAAAGFTALRATGWFAGLSPQSAYLVAHGSIVGVLLLAALYDDGWARAIRWISKPFIPAAAMLAATAYEFWFPDVPRYDHALYLCGLIAVAVFNWRRSPTTGRLLTTIACVVALLTLCVRGLYLSLLISPLQNGLPWLAGGLAALAVGLLLSLTKGGVVMRGWRMIRG